MGDFPSTQLNPELKGISTFLQIKNVCSSKRGCSVGFFCFGFVITKIHWDVASINWRSWTGCSPEVPSNPDFQVHATQPHSNTATKDIVSIRPGGIVLPCVTLQLQRDRKRKIKARSAYRTKVQSKCCVALREGDLLERKLAAPSYWNKEQFLAPSHIVMPMDKFLGWFVTNWKIREELVCA